MPESINYKIQLLKLPRDDQISTRGTTSVR